MQREGVYTALCPEPMMVRELSKNEFEVPNMIPIWFCNIRFSKKTNKETKKQDEMKKKNDTLKCFQTTSYIHLSIPLYIYLNIAISLVKRHIIVS